MREPLKDRIRLEHILTAINNIFQYTDGKIVKRTGLSKDSHGGNPHSGGMRFIDR